MGNLPTRLSDELEQIIELADRELKSVDHTPFSPKAFLRLKEKVSEYAVQLVTESVQRARRHQAENVSTSDVEQASQYSDHRKNGYFLRASLSKT